MTTVKVHHIALRTNNRRALERFYGKILGLRAIQKTKRSTWLDAGGTIVMIEKRERGEPAIAKKSRELIAFGVTKRVHDALKKKLVIEDATEFTSYFRDPDGRRIAVSHFRRNAPDDRR
jgi:glyoxylase I family protein